MADPLAVASLVTSVVVTPSVVAAWTWRSEVRGRRHEQSQLRLTAIEDGLNTISKEVRIVRQVWGYWEQEHPPDSDEGAEADRLLAEFMESNWITYNRLALQFGLDSALLSDFERALDALDQLVLTVQPYWLDRPARPTADHRDAFMAATFAVQSAQKAFIDNARKAIGVN